MTTATLIFLTLFTWMVSSDTWLRWDLCSNVSQYEHDEETMGCSFHTTRTHAGIYNKARLSLKIDR